jgi:hypothetical protein
MNNNGLFRYLVMKGKGCIGNQHNLHIIVARELKERLRIRRSKSKGQASTGSYLNSPQQFFFGVA